MRHLAIDYGKRRIGLALSDEGGQLATPLAVVEISSPESAIGAVARAVAEHDPQVLVVGLPLNMDGSRGPAAREVAVWAGELGRRTERQVRFVDERLSSFEAEQALRTRKQAGERITRRRRKASLDALAAAQLLQAYLDGRLEALED